jgi:hypothetical protein
MANEHIPYTSRAFKRVGHRSVFTWGVGMFSNASDPLLNILMVIVDFCFGDARCGSRFRRQQ